MAMQRRPFKRKSRQHNNGNKMQSADNARKIQADQKRYLTMAEEALSRGDRVLAEQHFQYADHCTRLLMAIEERQAVFTQQQEERAIASAATVIAEANNDSYKDAGVAGSDNAAVQEENANLQQQEAA